MGDSSEPLWRRSANYLLHYAFELKAEIETRLADELGIGLADHEALINLKAHDGALRMTDIADRLVLSRGGTTKLVDRLESAGYVARLPSVADRRVTMVEITTAGQALVARSRAVLDDILRTRWASRINDTDAEMVIELLRRVGYEEAQGTGADRSQP
jgi:DNA-binding MarR family transcriptional regulator